MTANFLQNASDLMSSLVVVLFHDELQLGVMKSSTFDLKDFFVNLKCKSYFSNPRLKSRATAEVFDTAVLPLFEAGSSCEFSCASTLKCPDLEQK